MFKRIQKSMTRLLWQYFVAGLLAVAPIGITVWAIWSVVRYLDNLILPRLPDLGIPLLSDLTRLPLVGVFLTLFMILLAGVITRHLLGSRFMHAIERALDRVPVVRTIYRAVQQLARAILNTGEHSAFRRVVMVEYPRRGAWALALTTGPAGPTLQSHFDQAMVQVFVPTTPNPTSGFFLVVPEADLRELDLDVEQAFKVIVSAGMVKAGEETPALAPGARPAPGAAVATGDDDKDGQASPAR